MFPVLNRVHDLYACARRSLSRHFYHAGPTAFKPEVPPSRFWAGKTLRRKNARTPKRFILRMPRLRSIRSFHSTPGEARRFYADYIRFLTRNICYITKWIPRSRLFSSHINNRRCISHNFPYFETHDKRTFWLYRARRPPSFAWLYWSIVATRELVRSVVKSAEKNQ